MFSWQTTCPLTGAEGIAKVTLLLRQASSNCENLSWWFFHRAAAFYTEQCTSSSLFRNFDDSWGSLNHSPENYGFISNAIFKNCMHAHRLLSNENDYYSRLLNWKYGCVHEERESLWHHCVWREPGQWSFSQYCIHLLRKPMRTDLLLYGGCWTSVQACTCFKKQWHKQDLKH